MNNGRMSEQRVTARMERIRKRGRPRKRWTGEFDEDLKRMGTRDRHNVARDRMEWRGIILDFRASEEKQDKTEEKEAFTMLTFLLGIYMYSDISSENNHIPVTERYVTVFVCLKCRVGAVFLALPAFVLTGT
jgi:hypothetical protein